MLPQNYLFPLFRMAKISPPPPLLFFVEVKLHLLRPLPASRFVVPLPVIDDQSLCNLPMFM